MLPVYSHSYLFCIYISLCNSASFKVWSGFSPLHPYMRFYVSITAGSAVDVYSESHIGSMFQEHVWLDAHRHQPCGSSAVWTVLLSGLMKHAGLESDPRAGALTLHAIDAIIDLLVILRENTRMWRSSCCLQQLFADCAEPQPSFAVS